MASNPATIVLSRYKVLYVVYSLELKWRQRYTEILNNFTYTKYVTFMVKITLQHL